MTVKEAAYIIDPETRKAALFSYRRYKGLQGSEAVNAATEEACRIAAGVMRDHLKQEENGGTKMKFTAFNAHCPYEIGDKIKFRRAVTPWEASALGIHSAFVEEAHTITDTVCEHSVKRGTVTFLYELDNSGKLVHIVTARTKQAASPAAEVGPTTPVPTSTVNGLPPEFVKFIKTRFG